MTDERSIEEIQAERKAAIRAWAAEQVEWDRVAHAEESSLETVTAPAVASAPSKKEEESVPAVDDNDESDGTNESNSEDDDRTAAPAKKRRTNAH